MGKMGDSKTILAVTCLALDTKAALSPHIIIIMDWEVPQSHSNSQNIQWSRTKPDAV